jgi:N-methylhydantoinase B
MHRGGVGADLRLRVDVEAPAVANTAGDGVRHAPYGLLGGGDGRPHRYRLRSRGGQIRTLKTKEVGIVVRPGDVFVVESSGGGGYGPARRRSAEARERDAVIGLVSPSARRSARRSTRKSTPRTTRRG